MKDTIVAQATPIGRGGVGILRVSGPLAETVAQAVLGKTLPPRIANYLPFKDEDGTVLDQASPYFLKLPTPLPAKMCLNFKDTVGRLF